MSDDELDLCATFISEVSANQKKFNLEISSDKAMSWEEILMAVLAWAKDEVDKHNSLM